MKSIDGRLMVADGTVWPCGSNWGYSDHDGYLGLGLALPWSDTAGWLVTLSSAVFNWCSPDERVLAEHPRNNSWARRKNIAFRDDVKILRMKPLLNEDGASPLMHCIGPDWPTVKQEKGTVATQPHSSAYKKIKLFTLYKNYSQTKQKMKIFCL